MKCANCNQEYADNSKFCPFCGAPAPAAAPAPEAAPAYQQPAVDYTVAQGVAEPAPSNKKGLIIGLIAALIVVVLGVGGFLLWKFVLDGDSEPEKEGTSQNGGTTNAPAGNNAAGGNGIAQGLPGQGATTQTPSVQTPSTDTPSVNTPSGGTTSTEINGTVVSDLDVIFPNDYTNISFTITTFDEAGTITMSLSYALRNNSDGSYDLYLQDAMGFDAALFHVNDAEEITKYVGTDLAQDTVSDQETLYNELQEAFGIMELIGFNMTFDSSCTIYKLSDVTHSTGDAYSYAVEQGGTVIYILVDKVTGAWVATTDEAGNVIVSVSGLSVGNANIPGV